MARGQTAIRIDRILSAERSLAALRASPRSDATTKPVRGSNRCPFCPANRGFYGDSACLFAATGFDCGTACG